MPGRSGHPVSRPESPRSIPLVRRGEGEERPGSKNILQEISMIEGSRLDARRPQESRTADG
jgi:hypothetical protein